MQIASATEKEFSQDVWYGQIVTIVSRWFLIAAGVLLTLWRADEIDDVISPICLLIGLIAVNFLLHGRFLTGTPMRREVIGASCVVDAVIISAVILTTSWHAEAGVANPFYIFYYPVLLGFALVFPWRLTLPFATAVIGTYLAICVVATPDFDLGASLETLVARVVTLATAAVLGTIYWRIERQWRHRRLEARR